MNVLDTNIWIYAHDQRDKSKQQIATDLIANTKPLALPWQVGCEFLAAARKLEGQGFSASTMRDAFADMQAMVDAVLFPTADVWPRAMDIQARLGLSVWDSLLVAACVVAGVTRLYTEDFGTLASIDGLALINPFR